MYDKFESIDSDFQILVFCSVEDYSVMESNFQKM
jgi:hypothetical protein